MRHALLTAAAFALACALAPASALAQQAQPAKPYKVVAVTPPKLVNDASLDAFRKELGDIAKRKDRAALARVLVYRGFFWEGEDDKSADPRKSAIDNLATALGLDAKDESGWETLAAMASEPNAAPDPERKRVVCAPGGPSFDDGAFDDLVATTQTDAADWGYAGTAGIEVRAASDASASVIETLGLHLVRMSPDETQSKAASGASGDWVRVVTPSGKIGFAAATAIAPLPSDQICYIKEASGWRIAGIIGGGDR